MVNVNPVRITNMSDNTLSLLRKGILSVTKDGALQRAVSEEVECPIMIQGYKLLPTTEFPAGSANFVAKYAESKHKLANNLYEMAECLEEVFMRGLSIVEKMFVITGSEENSVAKNIKTSFLARDLNKTFSNDYSYVLMDYQLRSEARTAASQRTPLEKAWYSFQKFLNKRFRSDLPKITLESNNFLSTSEKYGACRTAAKEITDQVRIDMAEKDFGLGVMTDAKVLSRFNLYREMLEKFVVTQYRLEKYYPFVSKEEQDVSRKLESVYSNNLLKEYNDYLKETQRRGL